jgi:hypothetical protein
MSKTSPSVKNLSVLTTAPVQEPGEDAVREYAYHLYREGNCAPGHDVDDWLEATACLKAHIPAHASRRRLHQQASEPEKSGHLVGSPAIARRESDILRRGREELESEPTAADSDVRTSLFDDHP